MDSDDILSFSDVLYGVRAHRGRGEMEGNRQGGHPMRGGRNWGGRMSGARMGDDLEERQYQERLRRALGGRMTPEQTRRGQTGGGCMVHNQDWSQSDSSDDSDINDGERSMFSSRGQNFSGLSQQSSEQQHGLPSWLATLRRREQEGRMRQGMGPYRGAFGGEERYSGRRVSIFSEDSEFDDRSLYGGAGRHSGYGGSRGRYGGGNGYSGGRNGQFVGGNRQFGGGRGRQGNDRFGGDRGRQDSFEDELW